MIESDQQDTDEPTSKLRRRGRLIIEVNDLQRSSVISTSTKRVGQTPKGTVSSQHQVATLKLKQVESAAAEFKKPVTKSK